MSQIILKDNIYVNNSKVLTKIPKRATITQVKKTTYENTILGNGEIMLVNNDNSLDSDKNGIFSYYIKGDGVTSCKDLKLNNISDNIDFFHSKSERYTKLGIKIKNGFYNIRDYEQPTFVSSDAGDATQAMWPCIPGSIVFYSGRKGGYTGTVVWVRADYTRYCDDTSNDTYVLKDAAFVVPNDAIGFYASSANYEKSEFDIWVMQKDALTNNSYDFQNSLPIHIQVSPDMFVINGIESGAGSTDSNDTVLQWVTLSQNTIPPIAYKPFETNPHSDFQNDSLRIMLNENDVLSTSGHRGIAMGRHASDYNTNITKMCRGISATLIANYDCIVYCGTNSKIIQLTANTIRNVYAPMTGSDSVYPYFGFKYDNLVELGEDAFNLVLSIRNIRLFTSDDMSQNSKDLYITRELFNIEDSIIDIQKTANWLNNKTIAVIGDSISTHGNIGDYSNLPEIKITENDINVSLSSYISSNDIGKTIGNHTITEEDVDKELSFTPTSSDIGIELGTPANYNSNDLNVWWTYLISEFEANVLPVCWSGARITQGRENFSKISHAWHDSQIRRCGIRTLGTMNRTAPDLIIIYRGINDFTHSNYAVIDDFDGTNIPNTDVLNNLEYTAYGFKEGLCLTIKKLREAYPTSRIVLCTILNCKRVNHANYPIYYIDPHTNEKVNFAQWNKAIREVADIMCCDVIDFDKCGITFENMYPTYISDSSSSPTHPNENGHALMAKQAIGDLNRILNKYI